MKRMMVLLVTLAGCGHTVPAGLDLAQKGMAAVDVSTEAMAERYKDAVKKVRAYCKGDEVCEQRCHVTDSEVEEVVEAMELFGDGYDTAAMSLDHMRKAWSVLGPALERMEDHVEGIAPQATP